MVNSKTGLRVGELPPLEPIAGTDDSSPDRLVKVTAHLIARACDRLPFLRKLSRNGEGTNKRSGLISDIVAVMVEVYRLNSDQVENLGGQFITHMQTRVNNRNHNTGSN